MLATQRIWYYKSYIGHGVAWVWDIVPFGLGSVQPKHKPDLKELSVQSMKG